MYRVLHLDDDPEFLAVTEALLHAVADDIAVETSTDPEATLDRLREGETDVGCLLTDYEMPGTDGLEVLRAVRREDTTLPVVLYTAEGSESIAAEAVSAGVTEYVRKDSGTDHALVLANRLRNAIDRAELAALADLRLEAIDAAREGIAIFRAEGTLAYANPAYRELYGYALEAAVGREWPAFHPDREADRIESEVLPEIEEAGRWDGEGVGLRADGSEFPESKSVSRLEDGGFVVIVRSADDAG